MADKPEGVEPQTPQPAPEPKPESGVVLTKGEYEDLRHRAEVSSQNFERLKKEEEKRAKLEARIIELESITVPSTVEDEELKKLKDELSGIKGKIVKAEVIEAHPQLRELWSDFESFRELPDNKGMNTKTAAKAFLVEKGLLEPVRKGLEKPTGGDRTPLSSGMSADEVKTLRQTDYKKYREMLKKGQIKFS
jgi:DNA phosphorothioation-dependent restriction protein DptG